MVLVSVSGAGVGVVGGRFIFVRVVLLCLFFSVSCRFLSIFFVDEFLCVSSRWIFSLVISIIGVFFFCFFVVIFVFLFSRLFG